MNVISLNNKNTKGLKRHNMKNLPKGKRKKNIEAGMDISKKKKLHSALISQSNLPPHITK